MPTYTNVLDATATTALTSTGTSTWDLKFEDTLRRFLPFIDMEQALTPHASLRDLGLDSMGTVELLADLETGYNIRFRDEALTMETFATPTILWTVLNSML